MMLNAYYVLCFHFGANVRGLPAADGERGEENGYEFKLAAELDKDERSSKGRASVSFHVSSSSSHHRLLHFILKKNNISFRHL